MTEMIDEILAGLAATTEASAASCPEARRTWWRYVAEPVNTQNSGKSMGAGQRVVVAYSAAPRIEAVLEPRLSRHIIPKKHRHHATSTRPPVGGGGGCRGGDRVVLRCRSRVAGIPGGNRALSSKILSASNVESFRVRPGPGRRAARRRNSWWKHLRSRVEEERAASSLSCACQARPQTKVSRHEDRTEIRATRGTLEVRGLTVVHAATGRAGWVVVGPFGASGTTRDQRLKPRDGRLAPPRAGDVAKEPEGGRTRPLFLSDHAEAFETPGH